MCAEVLSGDIAEQSIDIDYVTTSNTAQCMCEVNKIPVLEINVCFALIYFL